MFEWGKWRMTEEEFRQFLSDSYTSPYSFMLDAKTYWLFEEELYKDSDDLEADEVKALLVTRDRLKQRRIERAKTLSAAPDAQRIKKARIGIPDDIKLLVWERDGGACTKCGSTSELQYDHIIPQSLGGATTPENLQILCGICNRAKSNSIV